MAVVHCFQYDAGMSELDVDDAETRPPKSAWHVTKLVCAGVVILSVIACVGIAAVRSNGLTTVTVTALDADKEPRDPTIPFGNKTDALPDYEVIVVLGGWEKISLGARPNTSAVDGLTWKLNDPISVAEIKSVRLQEQDKLVSDAITEVQLVSDSTTANNFRFEFVVERSLSVGVKSFFQTPIGIAITLAFFIGIAMMFIL